MFVCGHAGHLIVQSHCCHHHHLQSNRQTPLRCTASLCLISQGPTPSLCKQARRFPPGLILGSPCMTYISTCISASSGAVHTRYTQAVASLPPLGQSSHDIHQHLHQIEGTVKVSIQYLTVECVQAWRIPHRPIRGSSWLCTRPLVHHGFIKSWLSGGFNDRVLNHIMGIVDGWHANWASGQRRFQIFVTGTLGVPSCPWGPSIAAAILQ